MIKYLILINLYIIFISFSVDAAEENIGQKSVFCYYSFLANFRPEPGKFGVRNIYPELCSHLVYAYADINEFGQIEAVDTDISTFDGLGIIILKYIKIQYNSM